MSSSFSRRLSSSGILLGTVVLQLCTINASYATNFDGIDITDGPLFLNEALEVAGKTSDLDSLISTVNFQTFEFAIDNTGRLSRQTTVNRSVVASEFSWTISGAGVDEALHLDLSTSANTEGSSFITVPFPLEQSNPAVQALADKFGQQTVDQLLMVDPNLFFTGQLEVRDTPQTITITPEQPGVWKLVTGFIETLIIPQNVIDAVPGGWQGDTTPSSALQNREALVDWRRYPGTEFTNFSANDFNGSWALPVFLSDPSATPAPPATRTQQFFSEKVDFNSDGTAAGTYSGIAFNWTFDGLALTLTSGSETFTYRLLAENNGVALLSLSFSSASNPSGFLIAGQGGQFQTSGLTRAQNLPIPLPFYYQTYIVGVPTVENGELVCEGVDGFFFTDAGGARQFFGCGQAGPDIFLNPEASFSIVEDEVTFLRGSAFTQQRRYWQILSENSAGLIVAIERFEFVSDSNSNGQFEDSEAREAASPRLIVLERLDLSNVGDEWNVLDIDGDGLDNAGEEAVGTSFTNADTDGDSIFDGNDSCQGTQAGALIDPDGCSQSQLAVQPPNGDPVFFDAGATVLVRNTFGPVGTFDPNASSVLSTVASATDNGQIASDDFDLTRIFSAPDLSNGVRSLSFTARGSSSVEPGFMYRSAIEILVQTGFLDPTNPFVNMDGTVNSSGVPDTFAALTTGSLQETLSVSGASNLAAIILELSIEGTWMRTPGSLSANGATNLTTVSQQDGAVLTQIYSSSAAGLISDTIQTTPIPVVGGQANVNLQIAQSAILRLRELTDPLPNNLSINGDFLQTISVTAVSGVSSSGDPIPLSSVSAASGATLPFTPSTTTPAPSAEPIPIPFWAYMMLALGILMIATRATKSPSSQ